MQQRIGKWVKEGGWRASLAEIRRFLDTWYFSISASGHLYVRPLREPITRRDLAAFLRRLEALGEDRLPRSMSFDFSKLAVPERRWNRMTAALRDYANQINAISVVISTGTGCGGCVQILRSIPGSGLSATDCLTETTAGQVSVSS